MAGEVYRFLLRMPTHLRERLTDATAESGRSLNAEIVSRLEQSLADNPGVVRRLGLRISGAWKALGERITRERRSMTPKHTNPRRAARRRRVVIGVAAVAAVATAALAVGALMFDSSSQTAAPAGMLGEAAREVPSAALRQKLAPRPGSRRGAAYEGGEEAGDGALDWQMHAVPGIDIPLAAITGSRSDWNSSRPAATPPRSWVTTAGGRTSARTTRSTR